MAGDSDTTDKTEEPTQKRLDEALERGDVVKSQEVSTWFVIAGGTLVMMAFSGGMSTDLTGSMRGLLANSYDIRVDGPALPQLFRHIGGEMIAAVALPFLVVLVGSVLTAMMLPERDRLEGLVSSDLSVLLPLTKSLAVKLMGAVVAMLGVMAAADYLFQYRQWHEKQKMSLQELKEEFKQTDGDPAIKGKLKPVSYTHLTLRR